MNDRPKKDDLAQLMLKYVQEVKDYYDRNQVANGRRIVVSLMPTVPNSQFHTVGTVNGIVIEVEVPPRIIL